MIHVKTCMNLKNFKLWERSQNVKVLTLYNFIYTKFFSKVILTYSDKKSKQFLPLRYSGATGWKGPYENFLG